MARPTSFGTRLRVYLTPEHLAALDREAALTGVTRSDVLRAALNAWLSRDRGEPS